MSTAEKNHGEAATACIFSPHRLSQQACPASAPTANNIPAAFSDLHRIVEVKVRIGESEYKLRLLAAKYEALFELLKKQKLAEVVQE
jgi:hypothetical protein